jgi:tetratricopeptide (TPR) repeat protein
MDMFARATKSQWLLCATCLAALVLAGCGGAGARKARHLEAGQAFLAANNFEKARVEFRNALQIAPNDGDARYENGVVDEKLGNPREAVQFYQGAIDVNPENVRARAALGRLYLFAGSPEKALETIKPVVVTHPDDAGLLTVRAAARTQLKDPDGALQDAQRALQLAPTNEDTVAVLAGIYKSRNEPEKAQALLENAIKQMPETVDLRLALAQLYASQRQDARVEGLLVELTRLRPNEKAQRLRLAQYYARLNRTDDAERVLRDAIKALPSELDLKTSLIDLLAARRGRDVAAKELDTMIAASPKDYDLKLAQAQFYLQGKEYPKAETVYGQIIAEAELTAPGITARNRLAALKIQNNDAAGAEKLLAEVLAKSPRDNDALILRGNLALEQKDPKTAIIDLRAVLRDQPNAVGVMRTLARAHLANGEPALAEETMRRAVDANPKDMGARLDLAQLLAQTGKPEQAKPVIDDLVKQQPNNMAALDTQFRVAAATNDNSTAKAAADAIVALQPKSGLGFYYQGVAAETDKRLDDAVHLYSVSLDMQPEAFEPLQALTRLLVRLNRIPDALKRLDAAAAQFPKLPLALNYCWAVSSRGMPRPPSRLPSSASRNGGPRIAVWRWHKSSTTMPTARLPLCKRPYPMSLSRKRCKWNWRVCAKGRASPMKRSNFTRTRCTRTRIPTRPPITWRCFSSPTRKITQAWIGRKTWRSGFPRRRIPHCSIPSVGYFTSAAIRLPPLQRCKLLPPSHQTLRSCCTT